MENFGKRGANVENPIFVVLKMIVKLKTEKVGETGGATGNSNWLRATFEKHWKSWMRAVDAFLKSKSQKKKVVQV